MSRSGTANHRQAAVAVRVGAGEARTTIASGTVTTTRLTADLERPMLSVTTPVKLITAMKSTVKLLGMQGIHTIGTHTPASARGIAMKAIAETHMGTGITMLIRRRV